MLPDSTAMIFELWTCIGESPANTPFEHLNIASPGSAKRCTTSSDNTTLSLSIAAMGRSSSTSSNALELSKVVSCREIALCKLLDSHYLLLLLLRCYNKLREDGIGYLPVNQVWRFAVSLHQLQIAVTQVVRH